MAKINKVCRISLMGGLIGAITTNPRRALDNAIAEAGQCRWLELPSDPAAPHDQSVHGFCSDPLSVLHGGLMDFWCGLPASNGKGKQPLA